jgi:hypothetical protein
MLYLDPVRMKIPILRSLEPLRPAEQTRAPSTSRILILCRARLAHCLVEITLAIRIMPGEITLVRTRCEVKSW